MKPTSNYRIALQRMPVKGTMIEHWSAYSGALQGSFMVDDIFADRITISGATSAPQDEESLDPILIEWRSCGLPT